jgi:SAM-dependent methyltransferase
MYVIEQFFPNWRTLAIHEASPVPRGTSAKLREASTYLTSHYVPSMTAGEASDDGWVNQDLENQTFDDESFDLVVTQDVFEHVFDVDAAAREIARTLRPGGAHVFTTPLVNKSKPTEARALRQDDGSVELLTPPEYHGNPVDPDGSLVTWHFGYDLAARITEVAETPTIVFSLDRLDLGIRAEFMEVIASFKYSRT